MFSKTGGKSGKNGRKAVLALFGAIVLISVLVFGCAESEQEPTEVITLKFSSPYFEGTAPSQYGAHLCDLVEKKTKGRVTFERHYGGTLAKASEHLQLLSAGSFDLISLHVDTNQRVLPLNDMQPSNLALSREKTVALVNEYRQRPEVKAIIEKEQRKNNIKIFNYNAAGVTGVVTKDAVKSLEDLKGKKINLMAATSRPTWESLGWIPTNVHIPDVYESLSRGVIDAGYGAIAATSDLKWYEVGKTYLCFNVWTAEIPIAMNLEKFESLPDDIQKTFLEAADETMKWSLKHDRESTERAFKAFEEAGCEVVMLSDEETRYYSDINTGNKLKGLMKNAVAAGVEDEAKVLLKHWTEMYESALNGK